VKRISMSEQHIAVWKQAAEAFDQRQQSITEEQWTATTPCDEWYVKDLVDHAVEIQKQLAAAVIGAELEASADWPATHAAIRTALEIEGALEGTADHPAAGTALRTFFFGIATTDLLVHAWDLARAIGVDEKLPDEAVAACHRRLQQTPPEDIRAPGRFDDPIDSAFDADPQTQFIHFTGRRV
jgi:uncharacterized protein (TIGR03086 family)